MFFFLGAHSAAKLHAQNRTEHPAEGRIVAALDAIANGLTLRQAADQFGISKSVLHRYYAKQAKKNQDALAPSKTPLHQTTVSTC